LGQLVTVLQSDTCLSAFHADGDIMNALIANWDSSKPLPTGTVTFIPNGNIVATVGFQPGEAIAAVPVTLGITSSSVPLTIQYSGDTNWTPATLTCTFANAGP
jgi:hypothetical protein